MNYKTFSKIWTSSGFLAYFEKMEQLEKIGYSFIGDYQDMDEYESRSLAEWLGDEKSLMDVPLSQCAEILPEIKRRAKTLKDIEKNERGFIN